MKKPILYLLFIFSISCFNSCDSGINVFSKADDVQLGLDVSSEIKGNPQEYPIYQGDPALKAYINERLFNHILASPQIESKTIYPYQLEIIDKDILNAFALPGGYLYVYTGLLSYLDTEAALAGVLGHEIAHAERRHATQRMTSYYGVSFLLSLILGENPSQIAEVAANLFVGLAFLANSRSDENDADEYSFNYLKDTRYYPGGVKFFFEKMRDEGLVSSQSDKIATFLSTHPDPVDRIANTDQRLSTGGYSIKNYQSSGEGIYREEYQANIKNRLGKR
ncbi:MAG: M48 family metalloprotease [Ignavibacteriales bacterium]|nr:MAG: M48 family metalloprotease [Ignavibacteriales bacterium]